MARHAETEAAERPIAFVTRWSFRDTGTVNSALQKPLAWVESVSGCNVVAAADLVGGMSSHVRRCDLSDGSSVVLRHITDRNWLQEEPDLIKNEATALALLADSAVIAPKLIGSDAAAGLLLMTYLEGSVFSDARGLRTRVEELAAAAHRISNVTLPTLHDLPDWKPWVADIPSPPAWGDQGLWRAGIDAYQAAERPRTEHPVLLHRDLHPLNVLWRRDDKPAIVDWVNACIGHPHAELGHSRWNLAVLIDQEAADHFLAFRLGLSGNEDYHPWWDLSTLMSFVSGPLGLSGWHSVGRHDLSETLVIAATQSFLRSALDKL